MSLYKAKVAGRYKDIAFAIGDIIDVDTNDAHVFGWDVENHVMEPYTEPVAAQAPEAGETAAAPETPVTPETTPETPAPEQAPESPAPETEAGRGEGDTSNV